MIKISVQNSRLMFSFWNFGLWFDSSGVMQRFVVSYVVVIYSMLSCVCMVWLIMYGSICVSGILKNDLFFIVQCVVMVFMLICISIRLIMVKKYLCVVFIDGVVIMLRNGLVGSGVVFFLCLLLLCSYNMVVILLSSSMMLIIDYMVVLLVMVLLIRGLCGQLFVYEMLVLFGWLVVVVYDVQKKNVVSVLWLVDFGSMFVVMVY